MGQHKRQKKARKIFPQEKRSKQQQKTINFKTINNTRISASVDFSKKKCSGRKAAINTEVAGNARTMRKKWSSNEENKIFLAKRRKF